ncbi:MAG: hypothetical protein V1775_19025 [Bacteroidota bacterium]
MISQNHAYRLPESRTAFVGKMLMFYPNDAYDFPESHTGFTGKVLVFYLKANMVMTESGLFHAQTEGLFFTFSQCRFTL